MANGEAILGIWNSFNKIMRSSKGTPKHVLILKANSSQILPWKILKRSIKRKSWLKEGSLKLFGIEWELEEWVLGPMLTTLITLKRPGFGENTLIKGVLEELCSEMLTALNLQELWLIRSFIFEMLQEEVSLQNSFPCIIIMNSKVQKILNKTLDLWLNNSLPKTKFKKKTERSSNPKKWVTWQNNGETSFSAQLAKLEATMGKRSPCISHFCHFIQ